MERQNLWLEDGIIELDRRHILRLSSLAGAGLFIGSEHDAFAESFGALLGRLARAIFSVVIAITVKNFKKTNPEYAGEADLFVNELEKDKLISLSSVYAYPGDAPKPNAGLADHPQWGNAFFQRQFRSNSQTGFYLSGENRYMTEAAFFAVSPGKNHDRTTIMGPSLHALVEAAGSLRKSYSAADAAKILLPNRPLTNFRRSFLKSYEDPDIYYTAAGKVEIAYAGIGGREQTVRDKKGKIVGYAGVGNTKVLATRADGAKFLDESYAVPTFRIAAK